MVFLFDGLRWWLEMRIWWWFLIVVGGGDLCRVVKTIGKETEGRK